MSIKPAKISIEDKKAYGEEQMFDGQPAADDRRMALARRCNWYNYTQDKKTSKKWLVEWLETNKHKDVAKELGKIKDSWTPISSGWYARMALIGLELTEHEKEHILKSCNEAIISHQRSASDDEEQAKDKPNRPNIQEIMIAKAHDAAGEIDAMWDTYLEGDIKASEKPEGVRQILATYNILAQHVSIIKDMWIRQQDELKDAVADIDADLSEGYSCYTKTQQKNMINYCAAIISELDAYHQSKKAKVGVRRSKPQSPEKIVRKLKHLRRYDEFKLETVEPTRILKSSELWVYNTKNRKLQYYVADEYAKVFAVKGTSILGFDTNKSSQKTLRKPEEFIKQLRGAGKPDSRKLYDELKTTSTAVNGRFNENLIIIKAT